MTHTHHHRSSSKRTLRAGALLAAICLATPFTHADDIVKLNRGRMISASAWQGGELPTAADTAVFNSTTTNGADVSFNSNGKASALTWGALKVTDTGAAINLTNVSTLTIGELGDTILDMSAATGDLSFASGTLRFRTKGNSTVTLAKGRTLSVNNLSNHSGTRTYTFDGEGTVIVNGNFLTGGAASAVIAGGRLILNSGGTSPSIPVRVAAGAGFGRTHNSPIDFAGSLRFLEDAYAILSLGENASHATLNRTGGLWSFATKQAFYFEASQGAKPGTYAGIITGLSGTERGLSSIEDWKILNEGWEGSFVLNGNAIDLVLTALPAKAE